MGATRLPGKMTKKIGGRPAILHVIGRAKKIKRRDVVILATTDNKRDDILEKIARRENISVYRGSENDVLDRYYQAAKIHGLDVVVRITGDCPFLDPKITSDTINVYLSGDYDYVSNCHPPTLPDGFDTEVCSFNALEKIWQNAKLQIEREHVFPYVFNNPDKFKIFNACCDQDFSHLRLTLDEQADLALLRKVYRKLHHSNPNFGLIEIAKLFRAEPGLLNINSSVTAKPVSRWTK